MLRLQPQRVPLGEFTLAGERVVVYISTPWYRQLEQLAAAVSAGAAADTQEEDDSGPLLVFEVSQDESPPLQYGGTQTSDGQESAQVSLYPLGLGAADEDQSALLHQLLATTRELRARIETIENGGI